MILKNQSGSTNVGSPSFSVFDESASLPGVLKNPNQFREAVIYEYMSHKNPATLKKFVHSAEAKAMVEAGTITYDTLDRLARKSNVDNNAINTAVCHVAKENEDDLWDQLVKARAEERRVMNELIDKYKNQVEPVAIRARTEIIDKCIPECYK